MPNGASHCVPSDTGSPRGVTSPSSSLESAQKQVLPWDAAAGGLFSLAGSPLGRGPCKMAQPGYRSLPTGPMTGGKAALGSAVGASPSSQCLSSSGEPHALRDTCLSTLRDSTGEGVYMSTSKYPAGIRCQPHILKAGLVSECFQRVSL